jgi:hypothetical protein
MQDPRPRSTPLFSFMNDAETNPAPDLQRTPATFGTTLVLYKTCVLVNRNYSWTKLCTRKDRIVARRTWIGIIPDVYK